jgi:hypothetical protein
LRQPFHRDPINHQFNLNLRCRCSSQVLTNRVRRQFESNSYPAGGVFLTLTVQAPARVAQATFSYDSGIASPNDVATPRATLCQVIGTLTPPLVSRQCPQAHPLSPPRSNLPFDSRPEPYYSASRSERLIRPTKC